MKSFLTLKSVDEVLSLVGTFEKLPEESVPLDESAGRYLAHDWTAPEDLPGFDRSTVDGYAVRARDVFGAQEGSPALLECVGDCPMGRAPEFSLEPGQTARIRRGFAVGLRLELGYWLLMGSLTLLLRRGSFSPVPSRTH